MSKVGFGVIGVGLWGEIHAEVYARHERSELVAVCDVNERRAKEIAQKYGAKKYYTNYQDLVDDSVVEAVSIATPDFAHHGPAIAAAKAKKHLLVEKPIATNIDEAQEIIDEARRAGVKLMVDFHNRWNPPIFKAKEAIEEGRVGKPMLAYVRLNDTLSVPQEMVKWSAQSNVLWFVGSHAIDVARWLFDEEVKQVYAITRSKVLRESGIDTVDFAEAILEFRGGGVAVVENCWILPNSEPFLVNFKLELVGSGGAIYADITQSRCLEIFTKEKHEYPDLLIMPTIQNRALGFARESIRHFVECVCEDRQPMSSGEDGLAVTKIITAILESAEKHVPVQVK